MKKLNEKTCLAKFFTYNRCSQCHFTVVQTLTISEQHPFPASRLVFMPPTSLPPNLSHAPLSRRRRLCKVCRAQTPSGAQSHRCRGSWGLGEMTHVECLESWGPWCECAWNRLRETVWRPHSQCSPSGRFQDANVFLMKPELLHLEKASCKWLPLTSCTRWAHTVGCQLKAISSSPPERAQSSSEYMCTSGWWLCFRESGPLRFPWDLKGGFWKTCSWLTKRERQVLFLPLDTVVRMRCTNGGRRGCSEEPGPRRRPWTAEWSYP